MHMMLHQTGWELLCMERMVRPEQACHAVRCGRQKPCTWHLVPLATVTRPGLLSTTLHSVVSPVLQWRWSLWSPTLVSRLIMPSIDALSHTTVLVASMFMAMSLVTAPAVASKMANTTRRTMPCTNSTRPSQSTRHGDAFLQPRKALQGSEDSFFQSDQSSLPAACVLVQARL